MNGEKQGLGTFKWADGSKYVGQFHKNKIQGVGTYYWSDNKVYSGNWLDN